MGKRVLSLIRNLGMPAALVAWLMLVGISLARAAAAVASPGEIPSMVIVDGTVTAKFVDSPLKKVLEVVARDSGARVLFYGALRVTLASS